jgi:glycosyltransferase involved in cell wall biosynthesis
MGWRIGSQRGVFLSTFLTRLQTRLPQIALGCDLTPERMKDRFPGMCTPEFLIAMRKHYTEADRVLAISNQTKDDMTLYYGISPERIDVVHLGVDRKIFYAEPNRDAARRLLPELPTDAPFFLYVGKRYPYKNWPGLLAGFAMSKIRRDAYLVAAGPSFRDTDWMQIEQHGIKDRVISVANPGVATLRLLYSCAEAFVYPSVYEGFGLPLLEAMACSCPVLASDIPVFREVASEAALYFDPDDPASIGKVLSEAVDPATRRRLIASGLVRCNGFSWDRCAKETAGIINRMINAH